MTCLTLQDLQAAGQNLLIECVRCGALEHRNPQTLHEPAETAVGALGFHFGCRLCGAHACITSPAPELASAA